jgi:hypothetical protein
MYRIQLRPCNLKKIIFYLKRRRSTYTYDHGLAMYEDRHNHESSLEEERVWCIQPDGSSHIRGPSLVLDPYKIIDYQTLINNQEK